MIMKKIITLCILSATVGIGLFITSGVQSNTFLLSSLALDNLEALAQNENGLPEGWVTGRRMDQVWLEATASISGGISGSSDGVIAVKIEGGITYVKVSCCISAHEGDACDKPKEHSECVNQLP